MSKEKLYELAMQLCYAADSPFSPFIMDGAKRLPLAGDVVAFLSKAEPSLLDYGAALAKENAVLERMTKERNLLLPALVDALRWLERLEKDGTFKDEPDVEEILGVYRGVLADCGFIPAPLKGGAK